MKTWNEIPRVSIVLPTYNQAVYLPKALDSIFNQTFRNYELIVVNDGSTDDTYHILEAYRKRYSFTVLHQENQGLPKALNAGFSRARGQYLTWTSSDNIMLPQMLEALSQALDRHPQVGLAYADWEVIDKHDKVIGIVQTFDFDRHLLMRTNYINACFLYRRECQDRVGLYDSKYIYAEDWEYWWRISRHFQMLHVPLILYQYRVHSSSLTKTHVLTQSGNHTKGYSKLAADFRAHPFEWYLSKLKWEWLRLRLKQDPRLHLQPWLG